MRCDGGRTLSGSARPPAKFSLPTALHVVPRIRYGVFSAESTRDGRRYFFAAQPPALWERYCGMAPAGRHYYEIIRAGCPCHLYFDLEFGTATNPDADGPTAVAALVVLVRAAVKKAWGMEVQDRDILELDSSTPEKFSRHLTIRLQSAAWESNAHVGAFVADLCDAVWAACTDATARASAVVRCGEGVSTREEHGVDVVSANEAGGLMEWPASSTVPSTLSVDSATAPEDCDPPAGDAWRLIVRDKVRPEVWCPEIDRSECGVDGEPDPGRGCTMMARMMTPVCGAPSSS